MHVEPQNFEVFFHYHLKNRIIVYLSNDTDV